MTPTIDTFDRSSGQSDNAGEVVVGKLGVREKKQLMESLLNVVEEDNGKFLRRLGDSTERSHSR